MSYLKKRNLHIYCSEKKFCLYQSSQDCETANPAKPWQDFHILENLNHRIWEHRDQYVSTAETTGEAAKENQSPYAGQIRSEEKCPDCLDLDIWLLIHAGNSSCGWTSQMCSSVTAISVNAGPATRGAARPPDRLCIFIVKQMIC